MDRAADRVHGPRRHDGVLNTLEPKQEDGTHVTRTNTGTVHSVTDTGRLSKSGSRMLILCWWYAGLLGFGPAAVTGVGPWGPTRREGGKEGGRGRGVRVPAVGLLVVVSHSA